MPVHPTQHVPVTLADWSKPTAAIIQNDGTIGVMRTQSVSCLRPG